MSLPPPETSPSPAALASPCPNCGQPWPENASACPNCGFLRPAVWPPTPAGQVSAMPAPPGLVTRSAAGDIALGVALSLGSFVVSGLGIIAAPILYFVLRPKYPAFARGMGFGWLGGMALIVGAFMVCLLSLNQH